jgi:uncharacterized Ntn-hydrolase superfamily protein
MRLATFVLLALVGCRRAEPPAAPPPAPAPTATAAAAPPSGGACHGGGRFTITEGPKTAPGDSPLRPVHTFSIVARDPKTGDLGVAVQSHWFAVGGDVTWAEPGVGAVATQSFVDPSYGPHGLERMRAGAAAPEVLAALLAADKGKDVRQVAMVDAQGHVAAHTGAKCIEFASDHVGDGYSVQANMMGTADVVPAMAKAFEATPGDLAERMLAALDAAQAAGGDVRGCQSAALLVVRGTRSATPWSDKLFDLRVDDSAEPLVELRRLVTLARAYDQMNQGDLAVEHGDMSAALTHYGTAAKLGDDAPEMLYWQAVSLASKGRVDDALPLFRKVFAAEPRWIELTRRLIKPGLLPDTVEGRAMVERITRDAR